MMRTNTATASTAADQRIQQGGRYSIEELKILADQGSAWAMEKVDEWEQRYADIYSGDLSDLCEDQDCEHYGEPVNICCDANGNLLEIDHGNWSHRAA
ncbi:hypothetical protein [Arthrobacter monumenti]